MKNGHLFLCPFLKTKNEFSYNKVDFIYTIKIY